MCPSVLVSPRTGITYHIEQLIGEGNFALTFLARNEFDEALVLKAVKPSVHDRDEWGDEIHRLTLLRHPYIIHMYDCFSLEDHYYIIFERMDRSLRQHIDAHLAGVPAPVRLVTVLEVARQLLFALQFIHRNDLVHRDLHVDNVLVNDHGEFREYVGPTSYHLLRNITAKIIDFGLTKTVWDPDVGSGRLIELSPELLNRGYTTAQSDIYQLGLVFYHLHTGTPAIAVRDDDSVVSDIRDGVPEQKARALGDPLGRCIERMVSRDMDARYQSALDVWRDLKDGYEIPLTFSGVSHP